MKYISPYTFTQALLVAIVLLMIPPGLLAAETESSSMGNVVLPRVITPENVRQCVEPTDIMRRDHMKFLFLQRDATVLNGIRTGKYSLTGCINCHAQPAEDGKIVRAEDPEYFCTACHQIHVGKNRLLRMPFRWPRCHRGAVGSQLRNPTVTSQD